MFIDKKVLITGGTGSIGQQILSELLRSGVKLVRVLDLDETKEFNMQNEYNEFNESVRFLLGDIRDYKRLLRAIEDIDIVFHTASLKHVYSCEYNPFEAVKTNVLGTQNIIDAALEEEVEKVIFTSSDKAVNPTNVMGASKLLAERLLIAANYSKGRRDTKFSSVRFGNVLGSRGSIIPLFTSQIKNGGPITITDERMTRFVMSSNDTIKLLFNSTKLAQGGEIFIFKMEALKIVDLAQAMIEELAPRFNHSPSDIKRKIIGIKTGEKLYEELMIKQESTRALETKEMYILLPDIKELAQVYDRDAYPDLRDAEIKEYISENVKHLTISEIKDLMHQENLL